MRIWVKTVNPIFWIVALAAVLRLASLPTAPSSFSVDEASYAYDAYSILETLRDRYGAFLPLFVRALDDYRESLFIYLMVPFLKVFGLNELAARLPSALIGIVTVAIAYFLTQELFNQKTALVASLLLAISPWHIFFSRISFRAILFPCLFCLALFLFLRSLKNPKFLPLSAVTFALSLHTYPSARAFVPLFLLGSVALFWQHLWKNRKQTLLAAAIFLPIFIFLVSFWITPEGMARANETGLESNPFKIIVNYLSYFNPLYLFVRGDINPRRSVSTVGVGELHLFEVVTVVAGLWFLWKAPGKERNILLLWLLLYPIPGALTEPAHAIRSMVGAPLFAIISAFGLCGLIERISERTLKKYSIFLAAFLVAASLAVFLNAYFLHYSTYTIPRVSRNWPYGMRQAITYAETSSYPCVLVSDRFWRPNLYILFYGKYPPAQHQISPIDPSLETGYSLGKYQVVSFSQPQKLKATCLLIVKPDRMQEIFGQGYELRELEIVKDPGGKEAIRLLEAR